MAKLSADEKFIDLSDYGRPAATMIAKQLAGTRVTPIHVTYLFGASGLMAVYAILHEFYLAAGFFLILKSILDAADGELARLKKRPSYTGRYLDSIFDILLNLIFLFSIRYVTEQSILLTLTVFFCIQLQGTLYNYYYVILRHQSLSGDKTSNVFETETPKALPGEDQRTVDILFRIYLLCYKLFDRIIYRLDRSAPMAKAFPKWFMSLLSLYGLGFQLLIIAIFLAAGLIQYILPFFLFYSLLIPLMIGIRKRIFGRAVVNSGTTHS